MSFRAGQHLSSTDIGALDAEGWTATGTLGTWSFMGPFPPDNARWLKRHLVEEMQDGALECKVKSASKKSCVLSFDGKAGNCELEITAQK